MIWCMIWLTHWGWVTHLCASKLTSIASDNGLSPGRRQAIIWNSARILLIGPLGTKCSEISIGIQAFSFKKMHLNMSSAKWRPFCLGLNELIHTSFHWLTLVWFITSVHNNSDFRGRKRKHIFDHHGAQNAPQRNENDRNRHFFNEQI